MKKSKILVVALIGLLILGGLVLAGCGDDCGGYCKVTWSDGKRSSDSNVCGAYTCSSKCLAYKNYYSNKDLPGLKYVIYRCDCD
jgi:hypothetical protein